MMLGLDIRVAAKLGLLLLFLAAVAPACTLMSPAHGMTRRMVTADMGSSSSAGTTSCPHVPTVVTARAEHEPHARLAVLVARTVFGDARWADYASSGYRLMGVGSIARGTPLRI